MKKLLFVFVAFLTSCNNNNSVDVIVLPITIDYTKNINDLIDEGRYDWVNENIGSDTFTRNQVFITDTVTEKHIMLICFNRSMKQKDVVKYMESCGLRPAMDKELYSLGVLEDPQLSNKHIIALGSSTKDFMFPGLWDYDKDDRSAHLFSGTNEFLSDAWFAAFRE
jgi:hypothetical protein